MAIGDNSALSVRDVKDYCYTILKEKDSVRRSDILSKFKSYQFVENPTPDSVDRAIANLLEEISSDSKGYYVIDRPKCPSLKTNGLAKCLKHSSNFLGRKCCNDKNYATDCMEIRLVSAFSKRYNQL